MARVTVGLPLRNSARHLREAIESVERQSFTDWNLLAIDDASTDSTRDIVREHAARDDRICLVPHVEGPSSHAENWNRVIRLANTEYVSMFGHDDVMMPALLEREIGMLDRHPTMALCFAQGPFIDEGGGLLLNNQARPAMWPKWESDRTWSPGTFGPELVVDGFVHPSGVMMRTAVAQSIPPFPEGMPLYLDTDYWSRLGDCGDVGYVAGDLLRYRLNRHGAYSRCIKEGINLTDTDRLFRRMVAHWKWNADQEAEFRKRFYASHARRAFRAAEAAWKERDLPTARLQFAICLVHARSGGGNLRDWIARWWNLRFLGRRFTSPRRQQFLSRIASMPIVSGYLRGLYLSDLPIDIGEGSELG